MIVGLVVEYCFHGEILFLFVDARLILYVGLEQPLCQLGKAQGMLRGGLGGRFARLLRGHSSLRTDRRATRIYRTSDPQGFENFDAHYTSRSRL